MPSNAHFMYVFDGQRFYESERHGGTWIPSRLSHGEDVHLEYLCRLTEVGPPSWQNWQFPRPINNKSLEIFADGGTFYSNYGGYVINFDKKSIVLSVYHWDLSLDNYVDGLFIAYFNHEPYLRENLTAVMLEFWPGWEINWTTQEDLEEFLFSKISYSQIPLLSNKPKENDPLLSIPQNKLRGIFKNRATGPWSFRGY